MRGVTSLTGELREDEWPLLYVDGVRVANAQRSTLWDELNPDEIESIEVIRGFAAEALYGSEASGGVIQIVTKGAADPNPSS